MRIKSNKPTAREAGLSISHFPAKTVWTEDNYKLGISVLGHCIIVGKVARSIIKEGFPKSLSGMFPQGCELVAALHDVGKISPTFVKKIYVACKMSEIANSQELKGVDSSIEFDWGGHAGVSQSELEAIVPFSKTPMIAGQHHGYLPSLNGKTKECEAFGGKAWHEQRLICIQGVSEALGMEVKSLPDIADPITARLVSGLTTVADWIGSSNPFVYDYSDSEEKIYKAVKNSGLTLAEVKKNLTFEDVFGFTPNEPQEKFFELLEGDGVYVMEAPMGKGKTEASLYAAYKCISAGTARGIYFALPTQLTSDKMHERMTDFLNKIVLDEGLTKPMLLHGNFWMSQTSEMGEDAAPGGSWFLQGKRGILAPFCVGTIDQALLAVMNVKHGFVRTFGLAGKVVILDEVHSYDTYTGSILAALVKALRQLRCTVIILSATLSQSQKKSLLGASASRSEYPLGTALVNSKGPNNAMVELPLESADVEQKKHLIKQVSSSDLAFDEAIKRAKGGQQVLWIENTVQEAQEAFLKMKAAVEQDDVDCGLIHSRFTVRDREINERKWVSIYGKLGRTERNKKGRILVGTQVLEQSIDIDADFLITRICPTDMLLQRLGRHWRHDANARPLAAICEAWILVPSQENILKNPKEAFGTTSMVYSSYVLMRTLQTWDGVTEVLLPRDIRPLIEATYSERQEKEVVMATLFSELEFGEKRWGKEFKPGRRKLEALSKNTLTEMGARVDDERPPTRYSDLESVSLFLCRRMEFDGRKTIISTMCGQQIEFGRGLIPNSRELAILVEKNSVKMSPNLAPEPLKMGLVRELGLNKLVYAGEKDWDDASNSFLRVALVDQYGQITSPWSELKAQSLYREDLGYWNEKKEKNAVI